MRFFIVFAFLIFMYSPQAFAQCTGPAGITGEVQFNTSHDVFQGCTSRGWMAFHPPAPDPCAGSPSPGDVCSDGSVYAGLSPDGNVPMYTTPADAGQFSWNDGTSNWVDTAMVNCTSAEASCNTGEANTSLLVGLGTSPSPAPYVAARHCDNLTAHGHSDWYLPARYELAVLRTNRTAIGGFNLTGSFPAGWYWSSSERLNFYSWSQRFGDGFLANNNKNYGLSVRCVRR